MREELNTLDINAKQAGWDATVQTNFERLAELLRFFDPSISVQGGIATPSTIHIQLKDGNGNNLSEQVYCRIKVCNNGTYNNSTNATIATTGGSTTLLNYTAGKDILVRSDSSGLIELTLTDGVAETVVLRMGPSEVTPTFANYHKTLDVAHA